jgi:hypothetical protein
LTILTPRRLVISLSGYVELRSVAGVSRANDTQDEASGMVNVEVFNFVVTNFTAPRDVIRTQLKPAKVALHCAVSRVLALL